MEQMKMLMESELVRSLGWTLLHSVWQVGIIAIVVLVGSRLLPGKNAVGKYWLATTGLFAGVLWSVLTFVGRFTSFNSQSELLLSDPVAALSAVLEVRTFEVGLAGQVHQFVESNIPLLVSVWVLGLVLFSIRLAGGWYYLSQLRNSASEVTSPEMLRIAGKISQKLNLKLNVKIAESADIMAPVLVGVFKPMILFPVAYLAQLSTEETEAVLAHELAHVKRYDFWINIVQSVVESVFFFNPFVWWISGKMREEREHCCDDMAVRLTGQPKLYAETLATVQELQISKLAVGFGGRKGKLLTRVKRIFEPGKRSNLDRSITALLLIALVSGIYWQAAQIDLDEIELPVAAAAMTASGNPGEWDQDPAVPDTIPVDIPPPPPVEQVHPTPPSPKEEVLSESLVEIIEVPEDGLHEYLVELPPPPNVPVVIMEFPENEMVFELQGEEVIIEEVPLEEFRFFPDNWFKSENDTVPPEMEEVKVLIERQMNMMKQQQLMMRAEMEKMQKQMEMMQNQVSQNVLDESLELLENLSTEELKRQYEEQRVLSEERIREAKESQKEAEFEMQQALKEIEKARMLQEMEMREYEKEHRQQFERQREITEQHLREMKLEIAEIEKAHKAYHEELVKELVKDGYLESKSQNLNININDGEMTVNGKKVKSKDKQKYDKIRDKHFKSKE